MGWGLRLLPWGVLALSGRSLVQGLLLWLNCIITLWNRLHQGGAAATERSVLLWSLTMGLALGQGLHWMVSRRKPAASGLLWLGTTVLALMTGSHLAGSCALGFAGFLGLWMLDRHKAPLRRSARLWSITLAALLLSTFLLPAGEMESVTAFRADVAERIHALRFGKEQLPEGHLDRASLLNGDSGEVLHIHAGQEKTLYLRAYVGAVYEDGVWTLLPESAYGGDYSGMLEWLGEQDFDPLTQSAAYYALCTGDDLPESSHLTVDVKAGARCYLYLPGSVSSVAGASPRDIRDARLGAGGLFGARFYTAEETSPARYVEGYDLSAAAIQKGGAEGVSLTGQDAHAWAEVYFDGIGWPAGCPMSSPGTIAARRPCWKRPSAAAK